MMASSFNHRPARDWEACSTSCGSGKRVRTRHEYWHGATGENAVKSAGCVRTSAMAGFHARRPEHEHHDGCAMSFVAVISSLDFLIEMLNPIHLELCHAVDFVDGKTQTVQSKL